MKNSIFSRAIGLQLNHPVLGAISTKPMAKNQYDSYFTTSSCEKVKMLEGAGRESNLMTVEWASKFTHQTEKIAQKLQKNKLKDTVDSIQLFLKDNFSYKSRGYNVCSPTCSWAIREDGIDCKQFSILASSILINLNIKHYLRFVIYENGGAHVYVIIPKEQSIGKLKNNDVFNDDYYTIDGARSNDIEAPFKRKFYEISPVQFNKNSFKKIGLTALAATAFFALLGKYNSESLN